MRIAVVGVGGSGSAACMYLAREGHDVVGYEQFQIGHDKGSSHGESRIIRYAYADPLFTILMKESFLLWKQLEIESGENLMERCGCLLFGDPNNAMARETERTLRKTGVGCERLSSLETNIRFPAFHLEENQIALFMEEGGLLRPKKCVLAHVRLAREYGADIRERSMARNIRQSGEKVIVETELGEEKYDKAIITAGPWMADLLSEAPLPLIVTRQQVVYLAISRNQDQFSPVRMPVWIDADTLLYGFPSDGIIEGVKLADHHLGETVDPNSVQKEIDMPYIQRITNYTASRFPDLSAKVTHAQVCLYTNTVSEDFILDSPPGADRIIIVSGCSGHGFKFTTLLGKLAYERACGLPERYDLSRFALHRFIASGSEC